MTLMARLQSVDWTGGHFFGAKYHIFVLFPHACKAEKCIILLT